jgi:hypothetical protein
MIKKMAALAAVERSYSLAFTIADAQAKPDWSQR